MRVIALIDGEHHPAVVRDALARLGSEHEIVGVLFAGGEEKAGERVRADPEAHYGCPVTFPAGEPAPALAALAQHTRPAAVFDLSGEPVLDDGARMRMASVALAAGAEYRAGGLALRPPPQADLAARVPVVAVIGTGKRTGKTAVCGHLAGLLDERGQEPVIVSMGRGGPGRPVLVRAGEVSDVEGLLAIARRGEHAASDYLEDAVLAGVSTVGCRRCGEGPAGEVFDSNVADGSRLALTLGSDVVLIEGSGAALPPVAAHRTICVVGAAPARDQALAGLGPFRLLRSQLVVVTGAGALSPAAREDLLADLGQWTPDGRVVGCDLVPEPVTPVPPGTAVAAFTTGGRAAVEDLRAALERRGVEVRLVSGNLARRSALAEDLSRAARAGCATYLTELKAAAIDTVAECAERDGADVVFLRNRPASLPDGPPIDGELLRVVDAAHAELGRGDRAEGAGAVAAERAGTA